MPGVDDYVYATVGGTTWFAAFCDLLRTTDTIYKMTALKLAIDFVETQAPKDVIVFVDLSCRPAQEAISYFVAKGTTVVGCGTPYQAELACRYGAHAFTVITVPPVAQDQLVEKEVDVIRLIACGYDNSQIAPRSHYSTDGVKTLIATLLRRFGAKDRAHLVAIAIRLGLI
ncbi:MAG TPA: helix-turn-helix transcriptional regulator [Candidatus Saccharimonas sp.]|nr:helix-turn-helix transcriptional regulator [Candidatus Saccharimonas sp.]